MILPIEKVKNTVKCEDYRPINTLKTYEKIIKIIVKNQLYIEQYGLLSKVQSGFRKRFSCETAVNYVVNRWKSRQKKNVVLAIFLDFKRAFETIDKDMLFKN